MDENQRIKYLKVIMCQTDWTRKELSDLANLKITDQAACKLLKSLYQNGHTVLSIRSGVSRCVGRKAMYFVEAIDLNHHYLTYRVDYLEQGSAVEIIRDIKKGWKPVSVW